MDSRISEIDSRISQEDNSSRKNRKENTLHIRTVVFRLLVSIISLILLLLIICPVYQVEDNSMYPNLNRGDIVLALPIRPGIGDVTVVDLGEYSVIRRVIAEGGSSITIDESGNVYINNLKLDEDYIESLAKGDCDIDMPYFIPDGNVFLLGDNRFVSVDSRNGIFGEHSFEDLNGKIFLRIWPISSISFIS